MKSALNRLKKKYDLETAKLAAYVLGFKAKSERICYTRVLPIGTVHELRE